MTTAGIIIVPITVFAYKGWVTNKFLIRYLMILSLGCVVGINGNIM